jgi:intracellular septation protein A
MARILPWVQTVLLSVVAPIVIYSMLTDRGVSEVWALIISGVGPVVDLVITMAVSRRIDEFSLIVLGFLVLSVLTSLLFDNPRLLLLKESALTGLFGVVLLGSLLAPKPLMFYFGRRFAAQGQPEKIAWWNGLWQYAGFRRTQTVITLVWGVAWLGEAVIRGILAFVVPVGVSVVINSVAPPVVTVLLIVFTITYARRSQARAAAASAEAPTAG